MAALAEEAARSNAEVVVGAGGDGTIDAVAYAVVAWLLIQVATQVFPFFELPKLAVQVVVLAMVIGFPIALVLAWAFELTPEGI